MDWISLLVAFIVFIVIVAIVVIGVKWICAQTAVPEPITRVVLWIIGAIALIVFLLRFVQPLTQTT